MNVKETNDINFQFSFCCFQFCDKNGNVLRKWSSVQFSFLLVIWDLADEWSEPVHSYLALVTDDAVL